MPVLELEQRTAIVSPMAELAWRGMESALGHAGVSVTLPGNASEVLPASNDPKRKAARRKATAAILRGAGLTQYGSSEEALSLLDSALSVLPKEFWAHFWRGVALENLNRYAEALGCIDESRPMPRGARKAELDA